VNFFAGHVIADEKVSFFDFAHVEQHAEALGVQKNDGLCFRKERRPWWQIHSINSALVLDHSVFEEVFRTFFDEVIISILDRSCNSQAIRSGNVLGGDQGLCRSHFYFYYRLKLKSNV